MPAPPDPAFWNRLAERYARKPVEDPAAFERKITLTRDRMGPGDQWLDVGCGTGSLALRLAPSAARIHGLDLSSEMIRIAREKADAAAVSNVSFHVGPFDDSVPFDAGSLDGVCAYSLLHLMADRDAALARIHRLLRPGGVLVTSTLCLAETWVPYTPLLTMMRWLGKAPPVAVIDKKTLRAEVHAAGFVDVEHPDVGAVSTVEFLIAVKPH